jgi:glycosyltransferase involved in cell wall biosynthesis
LQKILFLTPSPVESASERYRVYQFLPYFERRGYLCVVRPFASRALHRAIQQGQLAAKLLYTPLCYLRRMTALAEISRCAAVVVHRGIFPFPWPSAEALFLGGKAKVIFDFDDAIHIGHQNTANAKYPWIYKLKYGSGINGMLRKSGHVIAGNQTLADYAMRFNAHVSIIPTVVDLERYTYQPPQAASEDMLTIGWVGSRSTSPYLLEVEGALRRLCEMHPGRIRFRFYGDPQRQFRLPNCESLPFSLATEIADLRRIDIGIMPLPDNDWTRGKCAFKAIQYMALGIPTVTSPVGMARELVRDEGNGLWAKTGEEWLNALHRLVCDPQLRRRLAAEARRTVEAHYSLQVWGPRFVEVLQQVLEEHAPIPAADAVRAGT